MGKTFSQSKDRLIKYCFFTIILQLTPLVPPLIIFFIGFYKDLPKIMVSQLFVGALIYIFIYMIFSSPLALFLDIIPFFKKVKLKEVIILENNRIDIKKADSTKSIEFDSIQRLSVLFYFGVDSLTLLFPKIIRHFTIFKITSTEGIYYIPPSYAHRDELLQGIISGAQLNKVAPTTASNLARGQFFWQRYEGNFYTWQKSSLPIETKDLNLDVVSTGYKFAAYLWLFTLLLAVLLIFLSSLPGIIKLPFGLAI